MSLGKDWGNDDDRRDRAERIFLAALKLPSDQRPALVARRCRGDSELERTVHSLIDAHDRPGPFDRMQERVPLWRDELLGNETELAGDEDLIRTLTFSRMVGDRYRIEALLGRGGMGEVWRAHDLKLGLDVALKWLRTDLIEDDETLELLRREVRAAREVVSTHVCRVFDLHELEGRELIAMEYVDGTTLREILAREGPLALEEARDLAGQLLAGLEAIHDAGLVHRDLKPDNLMVTRTGRLVIMDFGIAQAVRKPRADQIAGTLAYMPPEQRSGGQIGPRTDLFAVGVVLAEMIEPAGVRSTETRKTLWDRIHQGVPLVTPTPWSRVITRAVAPQPSERWASATALSRALDEATLRAAGDEGRRPYPGLAAFERSDAEYFFGRELEVEALWQRLLPARLLAVVGPSGAGKSSFLRAGLLASLPEGWGRLTVTPGPRPFVALARALAEELPSDPATVDSLLRFDEPAPALALFSEWRRAHERCLLVVDQFEELFTQSSPEVQAAFTDLLGRLPIDADVVVLLSMRDDFLLHCQSFEPLSPIFSQLTPIGPPTGAALRRAIVHPARKCGYRFEDEALVEKMLSEVEGERGSLPTLAFAMAQLWELRDREHGLLTRDAYESIGGVGGALARHAESTLSRIGQERIPIVRELFRNLVTAQGTRAKRTRQQLLSVFEPADEHEVEIGADGSAAPSVLDTLIDARLLTSYEVPGAERDRAHRTEIEIVHESLLEAWPRLERWQAQDADSAELRDQLRQAAHVWWDRGKPQELLWTGTFYREFELWRERYPGGLSSEEAEFTRAMRRHAERSKRRNRTLVATVVASLIVGILVIGALWRQATTARDRSRRDELRARASQLLALARLEVDRDRTAGLAYALASLEHQDSVGARRLTLELLSKGPTALVLDTSDSAAVLDFSPDGRWLAAGYRDGRIAVWSRDGERRASFESPGGPVLHVQFAPGGERLLSVARQPNVVTLWSIPEGDVLRRHSPEEAVDARIAQETGQVFVFTRRRDRVDLETWPPGGGPPRTWDHLPAALGEYGRWPLLRWNLEIDRTGQRLAFVPIIMEGPTAGYNAVELWEARGRRFERSWSSGLLESGLEEVALSWDGTRLAAADQQGKVRVWSLGESSWILQRELRMPPGKLWSLVFDPGAERLAAAQLNAGGAALWRLDDPGSAPLLAHRDPDTQIIQAAFDPSGAWLATAGRTGILAYPIERRYPRVLRTERGRIWAAAFLPDGSAVAASFKNNVTRLWHLSGKGDRAVASPLVGGDGLRNLLAGPDGRSLLGADGDGSVWWVPLDGGRARIVGRGSSGGVQALAVDSRVVAAADKNLGVLLWNLEGGEPRVLKRNAPFDVDLGPGGSLVIADAGGIHLGRLGADDVRTISERPGRFDLSADGRFLLAALQGERGEAALYDLVLGTRRVLDRHGWAYRVAIGPRKRLVATVGEEIRVGPIEGGEPHLVIGAGIDPGAARQSTDGYGRLQFSADGQWIASVGSDLVLWPIPDVTEPPLHGLPYEELLAKLRSLTNLRVVEDNESVTGWGFEVQPFRGWESAPTW